MGSTQNTEKRLIEHNAGEAPSTRAGIPWVLLYTKSHPTRGEAIRLEKRIKARGIKRYLAEIDKEHKGWSVALRRQDPDFKSRRPD